MHELAELAALETRRGCRRACRAAADGPRLSAGGRGLGELYTLGGAGWSSVSSRSTEMIGIPYPLSFSYGRLTVCDLCVHNHKS